MRYSLVVWVEYSGKLNWRWRANMPQTVHRRFVCTIPFTSHKRKPTRQSLCVTGNCLASPIAVNKGSRAAGVCLHEAVVAELSHWHLHSTHMGLSYCWFIRKWHFDLCYGILMPAPLTDKGLFTLTHKTKTKHSREFQRAKPACSHWKALR